MLDSALTPKGDASLGALQTRRDILPRAAADVADASLRMWVLAMAFLLARG
jgi:hypothetical protein